MVNSNSSFGILLISEKLNIPSYPAKQVRTPKLMELVRIEPHNYVVYCFMPLIHVYLMGKNEQ
jgi:hypothetical protein